MNINLIKYWKIELFDVHKTSVISEITTSEGCGPFFTGYVHEKLDPGKAEANGEKFITLYCEPYSLQTRSVRISRIHEIKCTPIYENEDTLLEAARPLMKWLVENRHPHYQAVVSSTDLQLLEGQTGIKSQ